MNWGRKLFPPARRRKYIANIWIMFLLMEICSKIAFLRARSLATSFLIKFSNHFICVFGGTQQISAYLWAREVRRLESCELKVLRGGE